MLPLFALEWKNAAATAAAAASFMLVNGLSSPCFSFACTKILKNQNVFELNKLHIVNLKAESQQKSQQTAESK